MKMTEKRIEEMNRLTECLTSPTWWNPVSWAVTLFAPVFGLILGVVAGSFVGLLIGFQKGLDLSSENINEILRKLR